MCEVVSLLVLRNAVGLVEEWNLLDYRHQQRELVQTWAAALLWVVMTDTISASSATDDGFIRDSKIYWTIISCPMFSNFRHFTINVCVDM